MVGQKSGALATLKEVSDGILLKSNIPESKAVQVKQFVIDGYRELNLVVSDEGRVRDLFTMDDNYIIELPDDLLVLYDIYVPYENGIWSLTQRKDIPVITETLLGAEVIPDEWGGGRDIMHGTGAYYQTTGGRNYKGYYTVDSEKRRIHFRNMDRSEVMLDYGTSGIERTETTYIPMKIKPALEAYVMMEASAFGIININEYELHKDRYERQKSILRLLDFNLTAFTDAVYETMNGSYKR